MPINAFYYLMDYWFISQSQYIFYIYLIHTLYVYDFDFFRHGLLKQINEKIM